jgi:hypothetical protein
MVIVWGEETREGAIVGDRMTEIGQGGGDFVETFELHKITSLHLPRTQVKQKDQNLFRMRPGCLAALSAP